MVVFLNQRLVEFSFLYTTRSSFDLIFKQSARSADAYQNPVWGTLGALVRAGEVAKSLAGCSCNCADKKGRKQREYLHSDVRVDLPEAFGVNFQVLRLCPEPYGRLSV